jgi:phage shock protein PspC (stress-responsive transcriptional regulator)
MKKTLTVNLNNIVFHIDDDAYEMLQQYLHEIANHFESDEEKKEIMADIEARIAELFTEKLQKTKNVVNLIDVEEIIEIMGKPSQYTGDEEEDEEQKKSSKAEKKQNKSRRFYRDPENSILGGIAGGLSAYFNIDVTWIRILLVALVFLGVGFIIPVYIVVWFVAPAAVTASQRLEMQGEDVTVENIKSEINNVKNYMESEKFKNSASTVGQKVGDVLRIIFKVLFGFIGAIIGLTGILVIGALIFALFVLIFEPTVFNSFAPNLISNWAVFTADKMILLIISIILLIGCPIFLLVYWVTRLTTGHQPMHANKTASWIVLLLWFAGLFMFFSIGPKSFLQFNGKNGHNYSFNWSDDNKPYADEIRNLEPFHAIDISGNIELTLTKDSIQKVIVSSPNDFISKVQTKVENGVLIIYSDGILMNRSIKVTISADSIKSLVAKGACKISSDYELTANDFSVELLGASEANLNVKVTGLINLETKGASKVNLKGSCLTFKANGFGACEIEANELIAKNADIYVSGASHANVYASEILNAKAYGASDIDCKGHPKNITKLTHTGSEINVE